MIRVSILGTGNLAKQLFEGFFRAEKAKVIQVAGRNKEALAWFARSGVDLSTFDQLLDADIFIIAVSDDAVAEVARFLKDKNGLVVHTAGSLAIDALKPCTRRGVFYPLQTFSGNVSAQMAGVPFCIEASDKDDVALLQALALNLSKKVVEVSTQQRKMLHLAAVFCNNFTNHMHHIGQKICDTEGLPFELLHPLIEQTTNNILLTSAFTAQTGPARRNDTQTLTRHLKQLEKTPYTTVYKTVSNSILSTYTSTYP